MERLERDIEAHLGRLLTGWAHEMGLNLVYFKIQQARGWPDRMVLWGSTATGPHTLFVEMKRPGEKPRPLQVHNHKTLEALGFTVEVHDDAREAFESIKQRVAESGVFAKPPRL